MSYHALVQLFILLCACLLRQVYYEFLRDRVRDRRRFGYGDGTAIVMALLLALWTMVELYLMVAIEDAMPSQALVQSLRWGLAISLGGSGFLLVVVRGLRLWPGDFLAGLAQGLVSFGLAITMIALFCWLPEHKLP